ncbi:MAG: hypothetical protein BWY77_00877 [bacterium ADurb.Bin431]|nr:MAG: hypothetical protein BWY77_00877 [bacterium ADurb.Bin431]
MLRRQKTQLGLGAVQQPLAENTPGADRHHRLDDLIAHSARILDQPEKGEDALLLIAMQAAPHQGGEGADEDIHHKNRPGHPLAAPGEIEDHADEQNDGAEGVIIERGQKGKEGRNHDKDGEGTEAAPVEHRNDHRKIDQTGAEIGLFEHQHKGGEDDGEGNEQVLQPVGIGMLRRKKAGQGQHHYRLHEL